MADPEKPAAKKPGSCEKHFLSPFFKTECEKSKPAPTMNEIQRDGMKAAIDPKAHHAKQMKEAGMEL